MHRNDREGPASACQGAGLGKRPLLIDAGDDRLVTDGCDPVYGARPLKRLIQQMIENPLAKRIIAGEFSPGDAIEVDATGETYTFEKKPMAAAPTK
ncbi:MAG: hypothetical protein ACE5I3_07140 [Phycisphaerae bacterium]